MNGTLILGDVHLNNTVSDKMDSIFDNIKHILDLFDLECSKLIFAGDIIDVDYFTYKKIIYLRSFFEVIFDKLMCSSFYVIKGNHDKFNKLDDVGNTVLNIICSGYNRFDWTLIEEPTYFNKATLLIPHFYNRENFLKYKNMLLDSNLKYVIGHIGLDDVFNASGGNSLTVENILESLNKDVLIICGHHHFSKFYQKKNSLLLGAIKPSFFDDAGLFAYVGFIDDNNDFYKFTLPYRHIYSTLRVSKDNFQNIIYDFFKNFYGINKFILLKKYNFELKDFVIINTVELSYPITKNLSIKFVIDDKVDLNDIHEYIEYCLHSFEDLYIYDLNVDKIFTNVKNKDNLKSSKNLGYNNSYDEDILVFQSKVDLFFNVLNSNGFYKEIISSKKVNEITKKINNKEKQLFCEYLLFLKKKGITIDKMIDDFLHIVNK